MKTAVREIPPRKIRPHNYKKIPGLDPRGGVGVGRQPRPRRHWRLEFVSSCGVVQVGARARAGDQSKRGWGPREKEGAGL